MKNLLVRTASYTYKAKLHLVPAKYDSGIIINIILRLLSWEITLKYTACQAKLNICFPWTELACTKRVLKRRSKAEYTLANMLRKFIFPRTSGEPQKYY